MKEGGEEILPGKEQKPKASFKSQGIYIHCECIIKHVVIHTPPACMRGHILRIESSTCLLSSRKHNIKANTFNCMFVRYVCMYAVSYTHLTLPTTPYV